MNKIEKEISNAVTGAADKIAENAHIAEATAHFEKLLREQLARAEKMANAEPPKDFKTLDRCV